MTAVFRLVVTFLLVKLANLTVNMFTFPVLGRPGPGRPVASATARYSPAEHPVDGAVAGSVSLLVPMRDEVDRLRDTLPQLRDQAGVDELVMMDDQSSDGTGDLARALLAGAPHARVLVGTTAPEGWVGKNWACQQLADIAVGSILIFCDADVRLDPGAIQAVVAEMTRQQADVFSVFPRQVVGSLGERLLIPLIDDVLLCFLPFALLSVDAARSAATANGSVLAFTRSSFDELGGFMAVGSELVEDVALARRARAAGFTLGLALGGGVVNTRMYRDYRQIVRGLSRGLVAVSGGSRLRLIAFALMHVTVYTYPVLAVVRRRRWLLPLVLAVLERVLVQLKTDPGLGSTVRTSLLTPLSPLAFLPVVAQAVRREQTWKGRTYR